MHENERVGGRKLADQLAPPLLRENLHTLDDEMLLRVSAFLVKSQREQRVLHRQFQMTDPVRFGYAHERPSIRNLLAALTGELVVGAPLSRRGVKQADHALVLGRRRGRWRRRGPVGRPIASFVETLGERCRAVLRGLGAATLALVGLFFAFWLARLRS